MDKVFCCKCGMSYDSSQSRSCPYCGSEFMTKNRDDIANVRVLDPGTEIRGRKDTYTIEEVLSRGGGGIIYRAYTCTGETYLVKEFFPLQNVGAIARRIKSGLSIVPVAGMEYQYGKARERFKKEYETVRDVSEWNGLHLIDTCDEEANYENSYYVMEELQGLTWDRFFGPEPIPYEAAADAMIALLEKLQPIYKAGYYHRDLKPENILMTEGNVPVLLDFGNVKITSNEESVLTQEGVAYSNYYVSPRLMSAILSGSDIDEIRINWEETEAYSLAKILLRLVIGEAAFVKLHRAGKLKKTDIGRLLEGSSMPPEVEKELVDNCILKFENSKMTPRRMLEVLRGSRKGAVSAAGTEKKEKKRPWLFVLIALLGVLAGAFIMAMILKFPKDVPDISEVPVQDEIPTPEETVKPDNTEMSAAAETPTPTETPEPTQTLEAEEIQEETPLPTATTEPTPTEEPTPTPTEVPEPTPEETPTPTPTKAPTPTPTKAPTPTPTKAPTPTPTKAPTPTPTKAPSPTPTEIPVHTVYFDANNGYVTEARRSVKYGKSVENLPVPSRDYYTFLGWFTSPLGGTPVYDGDLTMGNSDIHLYALWLENAESDWVTADAVPYGASITKEKWTYKSLETKESRNESEPGWERTGDYWQESGSGSVRYAYFPYGFDEGNWYFQNFAKAPLDAYENGTGKRVVNNSWSGFIYWHWMYDVSYANVTNRCISHRYGYWDVYGNAGKGLFYCYFNAFESSADCPYLDNSYCCSQNLPSYNCASVMPDKSSKGTGCSRYFRFDSYTSSYTDYVRVFKYKRELSGESETEVTVGGSITSVTKYVKYRRK